MRIYIQCLLLVGVAITIASADELPPFQIVRNNDTLVLILSEEVQAAILKVAPGFIPWHMNNYLPCIQEEFDQTTRGIAPLQL